MKSAIRDLLSAGMNIFTEATCFFLQRIKIIIYLKVTGCLLSHYHFRKTPFFVYIVAKVIRMIDYVVKHKKHFLCKSYSHFETNLAEKRHSYCSLLFLCISKMQLKSNVFVTIFGLFSFNVGKDLLFCFSNIF